jgi:[ribosomal protein S5]-alanine N-acetyltransferase
MSNAGRLRLQPFKAECVLAIIESPDKFFDCFGIRAADGLRDFFVSGEIPQSFLDALRQSAGEDPWQWGFAVIDEETNLVVGTAGFKGPPSEDGAVEIAYGIVPGFQGRGYATDVTRLLLAFAQQDARVGIVRAHTLPENNASTHVLLKNKFVNVGPVIDPDDGEVWRWERSIRN